MLLFNKYDLFPLFNIEYYFKGQILEVTNFNMISRWHVFEKFGLNINKFKSNSCQPT